jgi:hypothetical protein
MAIPTRRVPSRYARLLRALLAACVLGSGLQLLSSEALVAYASVGPCASDPLFIFSNGTELDVATLIAAADVEVQQAIYIIHVLVGVHFLLYVAGALGARESWRVIADEAPGAYITITDVQATAQGTAIRATTQITGFLGAQAEIVEGQVNQDLVAHATL